ncbi:MAG: DUF2961 domain-containing protein [Clostridiales bacterium]|nr:DUF2961 domain-containing protein [Clostridiales bacterium]
MDLYYYVDYEICVNLPPVSMNFHCLWRRKKRPKGNVLVQWDNINDFKNISDAQNYVLLDAEGTGTYIGCNISIDHTSPMKQYPWFGEEDDMIFIDSDEFLPRLHGTGTEDYFCAAWGFPSGKYGALFHGISLAEPVNNFKNKDVWSDCAGNESSLTYSGKWTFYRLHLADPIYHGSDFALTASWYQKEPHKAFCVPPGAERMPRATSKSLEKYKAKITSRRFGEKNT